MTDQAVPTGTSPSRGSSTTLLTFLMADVRGYTPFTVEQGDEAAARLTTRFHTLCEEAVDLHQGEILGMRGDEAVCVFPSARNALRCAVALQASFEVAMAQDPALPLHVGVGIDAGEAIPVKGDYRGGALNLAARLCSLAGTGEVLTSEAVTHLAGKIQGVSYRERGQVQLKGFADPVLVIDVVEEPRAAAKDAVDSAQVGKAEPAAQELPLGGFLGAFPTNLLVGRDQELGQLLAIVEAVVSGQGRLVLLSGEPGAGKTRLAQELTLHLRDRGFLLATGRCYETEQTVPYYPFLDALATAYQLAPPALTTDVATRWPYLGVLLPDHIGPPTAVGGGGPDEEQRVLRAVTAFLEAMAERVPLALLLDDLHWADASSLKLLLHLARHTRTSRILLLGTYRDVEVGRQHPLERALRDLGREGLMERVGVRRLEEAGTSRLIATAMGEEAISPEFVGLIHRRTEGNPFFVQQVLRVLVERGDLFRKDGRWDQRAIETIEVPESIRSVIGQRLSRLSEGTQALLRETSVLGQAVRFDDLLAMTGRSEEELENGFEEAQAAGIVYEAGRDEYAFDHALTQQTLYGELSSRRRRRLHLTAGEALERLAEPARYQRAPELAWHFLEGDDGERALRYSLLAGDRAEEVFAHAEAVRQYHTALDLARELGDNARRREVLRKLGAVLNLLGRYDAAMQALEEAIHLARQAGDLDGESEAVMSLMRHAPERGKQIEALRWIQPLLRRLEDSPVSPQKLDFFIAYAYFLVQTKQFVEGLRVAEVAVAMADALGDERGLARAKVSLGHLLLWHGRAAVAEKVLEPVTSYLEQVGELPEAMRAASLLAQISWFSGNLRAATMWRERALRLARRVGNAGQVVYETCMLGYQHQRVGNMDMAWEVGRRALAEAREMDQSTMAGSPLGLLATLSWMQGRWDDLERYAHEMVTLSDHSDEPWWRRHGEHTLALRDLLEGRYEQAIARLEPLLVEAELDMQEQVLFLPALAEAYLQAGNLDQTQRVLDTPLALREREMQGMLPDALRVYAKLLRARGDLLGAEAVLNDVLELTRSMPYPFAEAQGLDEYGQLEARRGSLGAARARLEEALAIYRRLGARPFVEQTEQARAAL